MCAHTPAFTSPIQMSHPWPHTTWPHGPIYPPLNKHVSHKRSQSNKFINHNTLKDKLTSTATPTDQHSDTPMNKVKKKTGANKLNNYKDLKRENQFKKKESSLSLSLSQNRTVHTPQQNPKIKREKEREAKCKIPWGRPEGRRRGSW